MFQIPRFRQFILLLSSMFVALQINPATAQYCVARSWANVETSNAPFTISRSPDVPLTAVGRLTFSCLEQPGSQARIGLFGQYMFNGPALQQAFISKDRSIEGTEPILTTVNTDRNILHFRADGYQCQLQLDFWRPTGCGVAPQQNQTAGLGPNYYVTGTHGVTDRHLFHGLQPVAITSSAKGTFIVTVEDVLFGARPQVQIYPSGLRSRNGNRYEFSLISVMVTKCAPKGPRAQEITVQYDIALDGDVEVTQFTYDVYAPTLQPGAPVPTADESGCPKAP